MLDNKPDKIEKSKDSIARFNHWDERNKRVTYGLGLVIVMSLGIPVWFLSIFILVGNGIAYLKLFLVVPAAISTVLIHELVHYMFHWVFSKKRPILGFKRPFPYSKLRENSSISRNQGIVSALSPLIIITVVCVLLAIKGSPMTQLIFILTAYFHATICSGDIVSTNRLLKYPKDTRLRVEGDETVIFRELNME